MWSLAKSKSPTDLQNASRSNSVVMHFFSILWDLQNILQVSKNRCVLFDNRTQSNAKKGEQLQSLLDLVDMVIEENGGKPYTDDLFKELKASVVTNFVIYFFFP